MDTNVDCSSGQKQRQPGSYNQPYPLGCGGSVSEGIMIMAIEIVNIGKAANGIYTVTVQDTGDQTGTDEKSAPIYRTYSEKWTYCVPCS
jgi:hypothetical protein